MQTTGTLNLIHAGVDLVNMVEGKAGMARHTRIVKEVSDTQAYYDVRITGGFGDPTIVGEGGTIPEDFLKNVFSARYAQVKVAKKFAWTFESGKFDYYDQLNAAKISKEIVRVFRRFRNKTAADIFNTGTTTNRYDGVPLFSASHTGASGAAAATGFTWSNLMTASTLSPASLELMWSSVYRQASVTGQWMEWEDPTLNLYTGPVLTPLATRIINAQQIALTNNNDPNFTNGTRFNLITEPYITSTTAYYGRMRSDEDHGLAMINTQPIKLKYFEDGNTASEFMTALEMYTPAIFQWQGTTGNAGL